MARDCFKNSSQSFFGVFYVSLLYFFPTGRSSGLAEREPELNFDKYKIEMLRCKGVTKDRMVCVQHSSLLPHFIFLLEIAVCKSCWTKELSARVWSGEIGSEIESESLRHWEDRWNFRQL